MVRAEPRCQSTAITRAKRRARVDALLEEARRLQQRSAAARKRAQELIAETSDLVRREDYEYRNERELLLRRASEALKIAKASGPARLRVSDRHPKKRT